MSSAIDPVADEVKRLYLEGKSLNTIAKAFQHLGITKGTVAGFVFRNQLKRDADIASKIQVFNEPKKAAPKIVAPKVIEPVVQQEPVVPEPIFVPNEPTIPEPEIVQEPSSELVLSPMIVDAPKQRVRKSRAKAKPVKIVNPTLPPRNERQYDVISWDGATVAQGITIEDVYTYIPHMTEDKFNFNFERDFQVVSTKYSIIKSDG